MKVIDPDGLVHSPGTGTVLGFDGPSPLAQVLRACHADFAANTAGANLTVAAGKGTGTGAGGSILFQTAAAGAAGTSQNPLATRLSIDKNGTLAATPTNDASALIVSGNSLTGTTDFPLLNLSTTWNNASGIFTGIKLNVTETNSSPQSKLLDLQLGGVSKFSINKYSGGTWKLNFGTGFLLYDDGTVVFGNPARFGIDSDGNVSMGPTSQIQLYQDGSAIFANGQIDILGNGNIGFFGATPVAKQTRGANLTNSVTSGGSANVIADFSDLTTYSNSAATIRANFFRIAQVLKDINDGLRAYGLFT